MLSLLSALTVALSPVHAAAPASPADAAVVQVVPADVASEAPADLAYRVAGPFLSFDAADDYADDLDRLGFYTRVIQSNSGLYYVIYW